jgi:hypothetical protein
MSNVCQLAVEPLSRRGGRKALAAAGIAAVLIADLAGSGLAQTREELAARCAQLVAFYDYYGRSRSNNSDGARNHTRITANIDCERGLYEKGIAIMEDLLRKKAFDVPPPHYTVPPLESPEYGV